MRVHWSNSRLGIARLYNTLAMLALWDVLIVDMMTPDKPIWLHSTAHRDFLYMEDPMGYGNSSCLTFVEPSTQTVQHRTSLIAELTGDPPI